MNNSSTNVSRDWIISQRTFSWKRRIIPLSSHSLPVVLHIGVRPCEISPTVLAAKMVFSLFRLFRLPQCLEFLGTTSLPHQEDIISWQLPSCCDSYHLSPVFCGTHWASGTGVVDVAFGVGYPTISCSLHFDWLWTSGTGCLFSDMWSHWSGSWWLRKNEWPVSPKAPPVSVSPVLGKQAHATRSGSRSHDCLSNTY